VAFVEFYCSSVLFDLPLKAAGFVCATHDDDLPTQYNPLGCTERFPVTIDVGGSELSDNVDDWYVVMGDGDCDRTVQTNHDPR
jgi:hypothetical protein